jgi:molecular chaperone DnaJ
LIHLEHREVTAMANDDHYIVLGVPRTTGPRGIREAFHDLALRYHPDRAGPESTRKFQDILEAYRVLSDARARASYDRGLHHARLEELYAWPPVVPVARGADIPLADEPISLLRDFHATFPSVDEIFERLLRNFTEVHVPKAERLRPLDLDLILTPDEATAGGSVSIGVPVFYRCEVCQGSGRDWLFPCLACGETGMVEREHPVRIRIPAMVRRGSTFEIPIRGLGIRNLYLRVRIQVSS